MVASHAFLDIDPSRSIPEQMRALASAIQDYSEIGITYRGRRVGAVATNGRSWRYRREDYPSFVVQEYETDSEAVLALIRDIGDLEEFILR